MIVRYRVNLLWIEFEECLPRKGVVHSSNLGMDDWAQDIPEMWNTVFDESWPKTQHMYKFGLPGLNLKAWALSFQHQKTHRILSTPIQESHWKHSGLRVEEHLQGWSKGNCRILDVHQHREDGLGRAGVVDHLQQNLVITGHPGIRLHIRWRL